ncbi:tail fiber domain-containing protein [Dyadobacter crusticola]|uniref:tail fiber domain-containing protein n=1 Tax=Dyadobacter crusticola TaxID=292407 RepID=UPI000A024A8B|nr:tail fiber domain-containing protein [Dyadobacter crusticola]
MKPKQLLPTTLFVVLTALSTSFAQVKIGANPTTITPNANLDVEGNNNEHMVVLNSGHVGIGLQAPSASLHVQGITNVNRPPFASNVVAIFDPAGGNNVGTPTTIMLNGGRAMFGYEIDNQVNKYLFLRGNQATDIRLQPMNEVSILDSNAFVMSASSGRHGFIGLNTEVPQSRLDVRGTTKVLAGTGVQTGNVWNGTSNINGFEATTTPTGDAFVGIQRSGNGAPLHLTKPAGTVAGQQLLVFAVAGTYMGTVTYTGAGVQYNTTSDQRLKENIKATKFGLESLKAINVYDYNFKSDSKKALSTGVLAQELHKVYPQAVSVGGADEKTSPWQVDYSKLVPMLVKSVQELSDKVESLESEKAQLSAEVAALKKGVSGLNEQEIQALRQILVSKEGQHGGKTVAK